MMTDPESMSPVRFRGLFDSFLGGFSYTTRLSFTPTPIFGAAASPDFSWLLLLYQLLVCASFPPNRADDKKLLPHEGTSNRQLQ